VPEGPLLHLIAGLFFLAQAALLGLGMLLGLAVTPRRLVTYVVLLGWAAGTTLGHLGKLLSLSAWTWWSPGPRPKQAALYPCRLWLVEATAFVAGVEVAVDGTLAGVAGCGRGRRRAHRRLGRYGVSSAAAHAPRRPARPRVRPSRSAISAGVCRRRAASNATPATIVPPT
jgi:hypothetical protein